MSQVFFCNSSTVDFFISFLEILMMMFLVTFIIQLYKTIKMKS